MSTFNDYRNPQRFVKKPGTGFGMSGLLLYCLPVACIPATIMAFVHGNVPGIVVNALSYAVFLLAAILLRRGLLAESEYAAKRVTTAPKWPLKLFAALLTALATLLIAWLGAQHDFFLALVFAGGALLGMYLSYGFDPRKEKTVLGAHGYSTEEIRHTIDEAARVIETIEAANNQIRNAEFNKRIARICETARGILLDIEANPAAIRRTRKFLLVYLDGASKVTTGYANTHKQATLNVTLEENFRTVLDNIETVFREQKDKLLEEDVFDLDVQMEVLTTQLKNQGVI